RRNVIEWYQQTLQSRVNHPDTPIILVSQRLHENDLPGWLLSGGTGENWELVKVPAIAEDGTSFWEDRFPLSRLETMRDTMPYMFAGQYMQEPAPRAGGMFKPDNIEIIDTEPAGVRWVRG